ncbi:DUF1772 domain-containing protein [uncultured Jatrophihabitans sp.]|uniref:DUF1772 domain-containing protein n=1 Tax=uncultured Jatrophihabitans sp. TaxID=1610747 RepID=UPI0035CA597D
MATNELLAAHLLATAAYAGFQLTVQVLVYRQFPAVPADAFPGYEAAHSRRITPLVGVLFGACALTTAALLAVRPESVPLAGIAVSAGLFATVLVVTGLLAVPEHRRLGAGFESVAFRRLLRADLVRTVAATGNAALAFVLLVRA